MCDVEEGECQKFHEIEWGNMWTGSNQTWSYIFCWPQLVGITANFKVVTSPMYRVLLIYKKSCHHEMQSYYFFLLILKSVYFTLNDLLISQDVFQCKFNFCYTKKNCCNFCHSIHRWIVAEDAEEIHFWDSTHLS